MANPKSKAIAALADKGKGDEMSKANKRACVKATPKRMKRTDEKQREKSVMTRDIAIDDNTADNLIAVEMKKSTRPEDEKLSDKLRLRALTKSSYDDVWSYDGKAHPEHVCGYQLGIYIELDIENENYKIEGYVSGEKEFESAASF